MNSDDPYRPLDLDPYRNAGSDVLGDESAAPLGRQQFQGLPFLIGSQARPFIGLGEGLHDEPIRIAIDAAVYTVIVAHRLLGSRLQQGAPAGQLVAEYV